MTTPTDFQEGTTTGRFARLDRWGNLETCNLSTGTTGVGSSINNVKLQDNTVDTAVANETQAVAGGTGKSIAIGHHAIATARGSIAIGADDTAARGAEAQGDYSVAIGPWNGDAASLRPATASGARCVALGAGALALGSSIAIGAGSTSGGSCVAVGFNARMNGEECVSIGNQSGFAIISCDNSTYVGYNARGSVDAQVCIGWNAVGNAAPNVVLVGSSVSVSGTHPGVHVGYGSGAAHGADNFLCLGNNPGAVASADRAVRLAFNASSLVAGAPAAADAAIQCTINNTNYLIHLTQA